MTFTPEPRRIPNLFHFFLFLALTLFALLFCECILAAFHFHDLRVIVDDQRLQLFVNIATYALTLAAAILLFPLLLHCRFASGISWNPRRARPAFILAGLALGVLTQVASTLFPPPQDTPLEKIFHTPGIIWTLAIFGTLIAPVFEEVVFRGLLLPALAAAFDYMRLPKSLEALDTWRASKTFSTLALVASSLVTSVAFATLHAPQLGFSWPSVALLVAVSLILCIVRIRTSSTAASTLVHSSYNFSVFATLFIATGGFRHMDKL